MRSHQQTRLISPPIFTVHQQNAQRICSLLGAPPVSPGSELFVSGLPRDFLEQELIPMFCRAGPVVQIRILMQFSGFNKGYCFVSYATPRHAVAAVRVLDGLHVQGSYVLSVQVSYDNRRLFVGRVPCCWGRERLLEEFRFVFRGVKDVVGCYEGGWNPGYVFVDFLTHGHAMQAIKIGWPDKLSLWGETVVLDWAIPHLDTEGTKIVISNLPKKLTMKDLNQLIMTQIPKIKIVNMFRYKRQTLCIQFRDKNAASEAIQLFNGINLKGMKLIAHWANA